MTENKWLNFGQLTSPFEKLGYDKVLFGETKKKEIFTDTKNYLDNRQKFLNSMPDIINGAWESIMNDTNLSGVPFSEKERLANQHAEKTKDRYHEIMNTVWPAPEVAYGQQQNLNVASNVASGNVVVKEQASVEKKIKAQTVKAKKTPVRKTSAKKEPALKAEKKTKAKKSKAKKK